VLCPASLLPDVQQPAVWRALCAVSALEHAQHYLLKRQEQLVRSVCCWQH
jgi:hypothetical protein